MKLFKSRLKTGLKKSRTRNVFKKLVSVNKLKRRLPKPFSFDKFSKKQGLKEASEKNKSKTLAFFIKLNGHGLGNYTDSSIFLKIFGKIGEEVKKSFIFRWLTKEPDPQVVVIDLGETKTVSSFLSLLEKVEVFFATFLEKSGSKKMFKFVENTFLKAPIKFLGIIVAVTASINLISTFLLEPVKLIGLILRISLIILALICLRINLSWKELKQTWFFKMIQKTFEPPDLKEENE